MQRLGENAMWLREDNLSIKNEIVIPYDSELALWDRPSWVDSLLRLRWCFCPTSPSAPSTTLENTGLLKSNKKSKKKRKKQQAYQNRQRGGSTYYAYQHPRYDIPPPPPPTPYEYRHHHNVKYENYGHFSFAEYHYQTHGYNYPHQSQADHIGFVQPHSHAATHHRYNPVIRDSSQDHSGYANYDHYALSSLSSAGSAELLAAVVTPATEDRMSHPAVNNGEGISAAAAAAGNAAAAALKRTTEKREVEKRETEKPYQQQRLSTSSRNPNLPPLVHRAPSPLPHGHSHQQETTVTPSSSAVGEKPPLPVPSRSVSPSSVTRPVLQIRPSSPFSDRPRLHSDGSKRSVGTGSTRHRRKAHETFEFSSNSLQQIVKHEQELPRTSPPKYIEYPSQPAIVDWPALDSKHFDDDDNSTTNLSLDEEIRHLVSRASKLPKTVEYMSPVESSDDANTLERSTNLPALSWLNSWSAQGDDAAGNPAQEPQLTEYLAISRSVRMKEKVPLSLSKHRFKENNKIGAETPVYMPRCKAYDRPLRKAKNRVVVSGWAAVSLSDKLRNRLVVMEGPLQLKHSDISYIQVIQFSDRSKRPVLRIKQESGDHDVELKSRYEQQFISQDVCGRAGRCVCLVDGTTREALATILPVSLPKYFFRNDKLVDGASFDNWQTALFTPFVKTPPRSSREYADRGAEFFMNRYAPDEQYDAATHLLFSADSLL